MTCLLQSLLFDGALLHAISCQRTDAYPCKRRSQTRALAAVSASLSQNTTPAVSRGVAHLFLTRLPASLANRRRTDEASRPAL